MTDDSSEFEIRVIVEIEGHEQDTIGQLTFDREKGNAADAMKTLAVLFREIADEYEEMSEYASKGEL